MNYIKQLQQDAKALQAQVDAMRQGMADFKAHLQSSKFHTDTTIQTSDVHHWLTNIDQAGYDALHAVNEAPEEEKK